MTSEEDYKTENTLICDKSTDNNQLVGTILKDVMIPPHLTGLRVSVEKYYKKKPVEIPSPAAEESVDLPSPPLRQPRLSKLSTGSDDQTEAELTKSFSQFLSQTKTRISKEEISFILARNSLSLLSISRDFSVKSSQAQFEQKIAEEVNISGSLLQDFTNILTEFLKSQSHCGTPEVKKQKDVVRVVKALDHASQRQLVEKLRQLERSITRREFKKYKSLLAEVSGEVGEFARKVGSAEAEKLKLGGAKSLQEDQEKKLEKARSENRVLSERNNSLREEAAAVTASQEKINYKMKILSEVVNNFSQDTKLNSVVTELNNNQDREDIEDLKALVEGMKKLQLSYFHCKQKRSEQSNMAVNLVLSDGEAVRFTTNKFNNIGIIELERFLSKKVKSVSAPELMGGGYKEMKIQNGYVNCPTLGWGDGLYKVVTEAVPGKYVPSSFSLTKF